jgi:hypothetical protein
MRGQGRAFLFTADSHQKTVIRKNQVFLCSKCFHSRLFEQFAAKSLCCSTGFVLVMAVCGQSGFHPALLAFSVISHVGITHGRQFPGGVI